jgi:hypothetical protein
VPLEQIVLFAAAAVRALQAAEKQNGYPRRDDHGKNSAHTQPFNQPMHIRILTRESGALQFSMGAWGDALPIMYWTRTTFGKLILSSFIFICVFTAIFTLQNRE